MGWKDRKKERDVKGGEKHEVLFCKYTSFTDFIPSFFLVKKTESQVVPSYHLVITQKGIFFFFPLSKQNF